MKTAMTAVGFWEFLSPFTVHRYSHALTHGLGLTSYGDIGQRSEKSGKRASTAATVIYSPAPVLSA